MTKELSLCECGCDKPVAKEGNRFIHGHSGGQIKKIILKSDLPFCECGCGNRVSKPGNVFIHNHHMWGKNNPMWKPKPEPQLCGCGCGKMAAPGRQFISGHNGKDEIRSTETCKKISDKLKESCSREKAPLPNDWEIDKNSKTVTNKDCADYLGCYIAEGVLVKLFKNVKRMSRGNPGFDFYCGNGYKVDSKSSATGYKGGWQFGIRKNTIADYFILLAFESRDDLIPTHLWLFPGDIVNHKMGITIKKSTISKWSKYEQPIDKVILCCDEMKGGIECL